MPLATLGAMAVLISATIADCPGDIPLESFALVQGDPVAVAANDFMSGQLKFRAVASDGFYTPDAPGSAFCWSDAGMAWRIKGTTDEACSQDEADFQGRAWAYAAAYNQALLKLALSLANHQCALAQPDYE